MVDAGGDARRRPRRTTSFSTTDDGLGQDVHDGVRAATTRRSRNGVGLYNLAATRPSARGPLGRASRWARRSSRGDGAGATGSDLGCTSGCSWEVRRSSWRRRVQIFTGLRAVHEREARRDVALPPAHQAGGGAAPCGVERRERGVVRAVTCAWPRASRALAARLGDGARGPRRARAYRPTPAPRTGRPASRARDQQVASCAYRESQPLASLDTRRRGALGFRRSPMRRGGAARLGNVLDRLTVLIS